MEVKRNINPQEICNKIREGNISALSKAITLCESNNDSDREISSQILANLKPKNKNTIRIGITGVPGAGKSTFIEAFGNFLSNQGIKIAVLTIDPSSRATKGSILGDKTRMETLSTKNNVFIRPSPASNFKGGVGKNTPESIFLCESAGYEIILVETVGVGQNEISVSDMVDFFLLLKITGSGDELQGIKRGIIEMSDLIVINKCDGNNIEECIEVSSNAINTIRREGGPFFLEFATYRHREHCGPNFDNEIGYRTIKEFENWKLKDPISNFQNRLLKQGICSNKDFQYLAEEIDNEIEDAFEFAENSNFPPKSDAFKGVYS